MHRVPALHRSIFYLTLLALVAAFVLASCGGSSTTNPQPTPPPQGTTAAGNGSAFGCPNNAVLNPASKPNVTASLGNVNGTVTAHTGDVIAVQLPFGHKWTGPTRAQQDILQVQQPAGYANQTTKMCVWRFVAKSTGSTQLIFHSQALCKPGQMCAMYIADMPITIEVK
ncbi:hypothetical protein EPA93_28615 [Ktedonosporobacter rubrisoli]|uniref:Proteinase inhibitor I42 chagasin domain-containing protein n=1 Tax=Ktedonosporobacter rubrisoli TaxID=2509675 RepID=A0A4P6JVP1_KTERU|nr:hypothetical protein [Ktedonosporobacter rubrisoli]QBD79727.1 hypothetical protein EPA93_28615 [Ktedonosporobacter rubrisoli]